MKMKNFNFKYKQRVIKYKLIEFCSILSSINSLPCVYFVFKNLIIEK